MFLCIRREILDVESTTRRVKKARKHFSSSIFLAPNHIYSAEETIPEPRVCCQFFATRVGHKKSLCSWHDKFITCDWGSTTAPLSPLGLTNDTVALVLNFNYLIDIVLERGQKTCRTIFWLHLHSSLWSNGEHQGFYSIFRENWSISKPEQAWTQHFKTSKANSAKPGEVDSGPVIDGPLWAGRVLFCSAGSSVFVCGLLALARNGQQACPSWNARSTNWYRTLYPPRLLSADFGHLKKIAGF